MSNLIPTPRTDKNGRTIIRHMKTDVSSSQPRLSLPTVGALVQPLSARESLHNYFMTTWKSFDGEELDKALEFLQSESDETLPILHKYLTMGSGNTHAYVDGHIGSNILELISAMNQSSYDPNWRDKCSEILARRFNADVIRIWHALTVDEESGYESNGIDNLVKWTRNTQSLIEYGRDDSTSSREDSYWRGMTALALYQTVTGKEILHWEKELIQRIPGFIELAGTHDDLSRLMNVAVTRNLIDADAIRDIMEQQDGTPSAVGSGIL